MIAAIMQPYFFPYIGYFQLMRAVDMFVFHDDAQYIKAGWVNRNRILVNNEAALLTLPVQKGSTSLSINKRKYVLDANVITKIKQRLQASYAKAPKYDESYSLICNLLDYAEPNVAFFNANLLTILARELEISCRFMVSSDIDKHAGLTGQAKVIDICRCLGASKYINPIGGVTLYDGATFARAGIQLAFLKAQPAPYKQFNDVHVPFLSIIDILMFNSTPRARALLYDYQLVTGKSSQSSVPNAD